MANANSQAQAIIMKQSSSTAESFETSATPTDMIDEKKELQIDEKRKAALAFKARNEKMLKDI